MIAGRTDEASSATSSLDQAAVGQLAIGSGDGDLIDAQLSSERPDRWQAHPRHEQAACDQIAHVLANLREQRTPGVLRERERQPLRADCAWPLLPGFPRAFSRQRRHPINCNSICIAGCDRLQADFLRIKAAQLGRR